MTRHSIFALGALVTCVAAPVLGQLPAAPADSVLANITSRGRLLLQYDIAAWHGGDALMALGPQPAEVNSSFARRLPSGRWEVVYGRLTAARDTFFATYRATQANADSQFTAVKLATPVADVGVQRDMARAFVVAQADFGKVDRSYNSYVVPAPQGGLWVYLMPGQTDPRIFPLGGDMRYRIVDGVIVERTRFHVAILDRVSPVGENAVAMLHTSFESLPTESDVFVVLRRFPRLPEIVATRNFSYQIAIDGTISWTRNAVASASGGVASGAPKSPLQAAAQASAQATSAVAHIPVWTAKIDTVGTARRIMSPGYTEWRDSSTGWRMSLERTVEIKGADSASYDGTWRALLLPDGRSLVTRSRPVTAVQLYDSAGHFVREIGQPGGGPEEYVSAPTMTMKGDTLILVDGIESRVLLFMLDGRFVRSFTIGIRGSPLPVGIDPRGYVRLPKRFGFPGDTLARLQWVCYTTRGVAVDSLTRPPLPAPKSWSVLDGTTNMSFGVPLSPNIGDAFMPDGTLIYGTGDRMQFVATRRGRDTLRIFGRSDMLPVTVPAGFIDTTIDQLTRLQPLLAPVAKRSDIPVTYPFWNSMAGDDKGYLWVGVGMNGRTPVAFDIFGPDGRFLGYVPRWFDRLDIASFAGDHIAYVGYDKDRRAVLRIYKIDRRGM